MRATGSTDAGSPANLIVEPGTCTSRWLGRCRSCRTGRLFPVGSVTSTSSASMSAFLVLRCCWRKRWPGAAQGGGQALRDSVLKGLLRTLLHSDSGFPTLRWRWRKCWPGAAQGGGAGWAIDLVVRLHRRAGPAPPFFSLKKIENRGALCLCFLQRAPRESGPCGWGDQKLARRKPPPQF